MDERTARLKQDLEDRKAALKAELNKLESDLSGHLTDIQEDVAETVDPRKWIQKHPLKLVGAAVLIGFLAGNRDDGTNTAGKITVVGSVVAALKTYAARKAVDQIVSFVEDVGGKKSR